MSGRIVPGAGRTGPRLEFRNRIWRDVAQSVVLGGVDSRVDPESVRAALRRLHALDPTSPALCRLPGARVRWVPVPAAQLEAWLHTVVVDERDGMEESPAQLAERLVRRPVGAVPFTITVGRRAVGFQINHALGDGAYAVRSLVAGLLRAAVAGGVPADLARPTEPADRHLVSRAAWNTLLREPAPAPWRAALSRVTAARAVPSAPGAPAHPGTDGASSLRLVTRDGTAAALAALRRWGADHAPDVSAGVLVMVAARIALEEAGAVGPSTDTVAMFDARRYLPRGSRVTGNFCAALRITDARCRDLAQVAAQITRDADLGLPLISMLAALAGESVHAARAAVLTAVGSAPARGVGTGRPEPVGPVVLSHLGALGHLRTLPWADGPGQVVTSAAPGSSSGITVSSTEWAKALHATIAFDAARVSEAAVTEAATRLVEDPCGLLELALPHRVGQPA